MNKILMMENACRELLQYGVFDRQAKCKYLVKRFLLRRKTVGEDLIFWPTGLLAAGLWHCREELLQDGEGSSEEGEKTPETHRLIETIENTIAAYYGRWLKKKMPVMVLDDLLAGETLLHIYLEMERQSAANLPGLSRETVREALDRLAAYAAGHPTDGMGSFPYRPAYGDQSVFVDSIGLVCPFLYRYGEIFERQEYRELALRQIVNFLSYGMDGAAGLPYHGYDAADGCKFGIIGWGRAVGWLLRGMVGCVLSDYGRERLRAPCIALVDAALAYQRRDGYFSWQLEALEGPADTSATGMICAAIRQGMENGILEGDNYENALRAGRCALEKSVRDGLVYNCSGECEGFSCYPQRYGAYPWALGPALEVM